MARITDYAQLGTAAANDLLPIVDVSDTTMAPTGTNKKVPLSQLGFPLQPSGDASGAADTAAIQALLNGSGHTAVLAPGTFYVTGLTAVNSMTLAGAGASATIVNVVGAAAHGLSWAGTSLAYVTVRSLTLQGPGAGTGKGIYLAASGGGNIVAAHFEDLQIRTFGSHGFHATILIASSLTNVVAQSNGGAGFSLSGGGTCTSVVFQNCFANANATYGFDIESSTYCALAGCAADANATGYYILNPNGVTLTGCGAESSPTCFEVSGGTGATFTGCFTYNCSGRSFWATGTAKNVSFINCTEVTPLSATASFQFDAGTNVTVMGWNYTTAPVQTQAPNLLSDASGTLSISGPSFLSTTGFYGVASHNAGTATANSAPVLAPAFANGVASQLSDLTRDYMVYLQIGTPGTAFTLAVGPTSGVANAIIVSATPAATQLLAVRLPAGWFLKWAGTSTTMASQRAIGC